MGRSAAAIPNLSSPVNVSVEHLGPCKKLLRVEVPLERVTATFEEVTGQFQRQAQLPGFRPGKAPKHLIVRSFEGRIADEARKQLLDKSYREASQQEKLRVIATLNVEELQFGRNEPMQYTVTLEVAPEFDLPEYKGLSAKRELAVATDADVDRALNILREQQAEYNDVQRPLQDGDVAVVNYRGTCEGKPLTDLAPTAVGLTSKENFWVLIKPDAFLPGFTTPLIGASVGDQRQVTLTLPEDFVQKELSGKTVNYDVTVVGVKEKVLPTVDDAFAGRFGASGMGELLQGIRADLQRELDSRQKRSVRDQLLTQLLDPLNLELPESVLTTETRNLVYNIVNENQQRGIPKEVIEEKKDEIFASASASARQRVKGAFVLNRIAEVEKITVENKEITQRVILLAQQNRMEPDKMFKTLQERNAFPEIQQEILTGKVLDFLELNAKVEETAPLPAATPSEPAQA